MNLAPCPCGKTPTDLHINTFYSAKYGQVCGNCCGEWIIEFRTEYKKDGTAEPYELAVKAWNEAERSTDRLRWLFDHWHKEEVRDSMDSAMIYDRDMVSALDELIEEARGE